MIEVRITHGVGSDGTLVTVFSVDACSEENRRVTDVCKGQQNHDAPLCSRHVNMSADFQAIPASHRRFREQHADQ
jgi:hypothetical protein